MGTLDVMKVAVVPSGAGIGDLRFKVRQAQLPRDQALEQGVAEGGEGLCLIQSDFFDVFMAELSVGSPAQPAGGSVLPRRTCRIHSMLTMHTASQLMPDANPASTSVPKCT